MVGSSPNAQRVQLGVKQVQKSANLQGKPALIVHGRNDTLIPINFTSRPYYAQNKVVEAAGSKLSYIEVDNAQHFDAFLPFPGYAQLVLRARVLQSRARRDVRAPDNGCATAIVPGGQDDAAWKRREPSDRSERSADLGYARRERDHVRWNDADDPELTGLCRRSIRPAARGPFLAKRDSGHDNANGPAIPACLNAVMATAAQFAW